MTSLYDSDYLAWAEGQAEALRRLAERHPGLAAELDVAHLLEELEYMAGAPKTEIVSRLRLLLAHLAKWRWQPGLRSRSWSNSVAEQRDQIEGLLEDNPSLKSRLPEAMAKAWPRTRKLAHRETGLPLDTFPEACPFTLEQALDESFLPD